MTELFKKFDFRKNKDLIFIIVVALITLFLGRKIWDHQKMRSSSIRGKIQTYQQEIELANKIKKLSQEFDKLKNIGWQTKETVSVMGKINDLASKHNIDISSFDPSGLQDQQYYFTLDMSMNIRADYSDLVMFLSEIENLETLTKITRLQITPELEQSESPLVEAFLSITAFISKK
ncbi:MAG: type 4a pilus biogenesis protein PilO [Candidatus Omnitrophica bacterium]|nr:type 4a pilus biogenesis protein PilO [Candidatus Omnitrophota bacterium]MDD5352638.1 type 4a pilus biogenesis protein PilO [Candidatus Omnitrophota bacterium]MDD5550237.1 type 4a pilus biogenesis protein PilO [Candidatus Omnitrophota bacterium]